MLRSRRPDEGRRGGDTWHHVLHQQAIVYFQLFFCSALSSLRISPIRLEYRGRFAPFTAPARRLLVRWQLIHVTVISLVAPFRHNCTCTLIPAWLRHNTRQISRRRYGFTIEFQNDISCFDACFICRAVLLYRCDQRAGWFGQSERFGQFLGYLLNQYANPARLTLPVAIN